VRASTQPAAMQHSRVRERANKRRQPSWKIGLIEAHNPTWRDLFADVVRADGSSAERRTTVLRVKVLNSLACAQEGRAT